MNRGQAFVMHHQAAIAVEPCQCAQPPRDATLEHEDDAGECRPITQAWVAPFGFRRLRWKQRRDDWLEFIADRSVLMNLVYYRFC